GQYRTHLPSLVYHLKPLRLQDLFRLGPLLSKDGGISQKPARYDAPDEPRDERRGDNHPCLFPLHAPLLLSLPVLHTNSEDAQRGKSAFAALRGTEGPAPAASMKLLCS